MLDVRKSLFPSSKTISQYLGKHGSLVLLLLSFKTPAFFNEQDFKSIIFHLHARGNYTSGDFRSGIQSAAYVNEESLDNCMWVPYPNTLMLQLFLPSFACKRRL